MDTRQHYWISMSQLRNWDKDHLAKCLRPSRSIQERFEQSKKFLSTWMTNMTRKTCWGKSKLWNTFQGKNIIFTRRNCIMFISIKSLPTGMILAWNLRNLVKLRFTWFKISWISISQNWLDRAIIAILPKNISKS